LHVHRSGVRAELTTFTRSRPLAAQIVRAIIFSADADVAVSDTLSVFAIPASQNVPGAWRAGSQFHAHTLQVACIFIFAQALDGKPNVNSARSLAGKR
jgi:hypothetical protein